MARMDRLALSSQFATRFRARTWLDVCGGHQQTSLLYCSFVTRIVQVRDALPLSHAAPQEVAKTRNDPQNAFDRVHPLLGPLCRQSLKPVDHCQQER